MGWAGSGGNVLETGERNRVSKLAETWSERKGSVLELVTWC